MTAYLILGVLLAAAALGATLTTKPALARALAIGSSGFAAIVATGAMLRTMQPQVLPTGLGWRLAEILIPLELGTSRATATITFAVLVVAAGVQAYSTWYLADDPRYPAFAATVSLFTAAMVVLVHARDLVLVLLGWEVMGWCSYLLIGHWSGKASARAAALKAFLVTRVADVGVVLAVVGLVAGARSSRLEDVLATWAPAADCVASGACVAPDQTWRAILVTALVLGVLGKSAQIPFQDWLPDAMEGPTPASALIHAATMVAAGTVVLALVFPVLSQVPAARWLLGVSTALTMVLAAVLAFGQSDLKRLLAWSTVSQVAIMLSILASSTSAAGVDAGLFHLWSHAFFKALLFLALGLLAVIAGGTSAVLLRGSAMRSRLGRWALLLGLLSLAGVPILVGGVSKEHVVAQAYEGAVHEGPGLIVLLALLTTIVLTAAYATRVYLVVAELIDVDAVIAQERQREGSRSAARLAALDPSGRGWVNAVLLTLSVLTLVGALALPLRLFEPGDAQWVWLALTVLLLLVGCALAFALGRRGDPSVRLVGSRARWFDTGFGAGTAYRLVGRGVQRVAGVAALLDTAVLDGYVRGVALTATAAGAGGARAHRDGRARSGLWLVVAGLMVVAGIAAAVWMLAGGGGRS